MIGNAITLGRLSGIEIRLHYSWFIIFFLVTWSLASHYFPKVHPGWELSTYWSMGVATAVLSFISVLAHELAHSFVARGNGVPVNDITLFIFGGAAQMDREPQRARDELLIAAAGPTASLAIGLTFGALWWLTSGRDGAVHALSAWLAWINVGLAVFNLIPGFPLDGGRMFRAVVWSVTRNLERATRMAAGLGRLVAFGFIFWGFLQIVGGAWVDGLWIVFVGWFLDNAAAQSYEQVTLKKLLAGHTAREVMMVDCPQIPRRLTLDVLIDHLVLASGRRCFPVVEDNELHGLLTLHRIKSVPRDRWPFTRVEDVMIPRAELKAVQPDDDLTTVMERMAAEDVNQFPVLDDGRLLGMVARDNLLSFIQVRAEMASRRPVS